MSRADGVDAGLEVVVIPVADVLGDLRRRAQRSPARSHGGTRLNGIPPDWTVDVREEIDDLLPGRLFVVTQVSADQFALRLSYEIHPAFGRTEPEQAAAVSWDMRASDDVGQTYQEAGGAFGESADGTYTEGVRSLQPAPPREARLVVLELIPPGGGHGPVRVLRVSLLLREGVRQASAVIEGSPVET